MVLVKYMKNHITLLIVFIVLFALAFIFDSPEEIFNGYINILQSPSVLISDYLCIGGLGATLFNVATIMLLNLALVKNLDSA